MIILKKVISLILALGIIICMFGVTASAETVDFDAVQNSFLKIQRVDADGDGNYTTADASLILKVAAGIVEDPKDGSYDINNDGEVTISDAQKTLRIASGIDSVLTEKEALDLFNRKLNSVKSERPGFQKTATVVCPSIKVTTMNVPISDMNVTDLEFDKYCDKIVKLMNTFPYNLLLDDAMKAQLKEMQAQAKESYEPQVSEKTVDRYSNAHYSYFPVNNLGWSSRLTSDDVESVTCTVADGVMTFTVKLGACTYIGDEYPTGTAGFSQRQTLPYGKVFNIPAFDESDGSTLNKISFSDGVVTLKADVKTSDTLSADYYYGYVVDITAAQQADSSLVMKTKTTSKVTENYKMNKVTVG